MPSSVASLAAFAALCATIIGAINAYVPEPYMDEIFHVPQTQRYCQGRWTEWDPKITTFPGLYFIGAAASRAATAIPALRPCSAAFLRGVNAALAVATAPVFYALAAALDPKRTRPQLLWMTAVCCLFPLHFFYSFLYYTDVASMLCVLGTWLAAERARPRAAALLGAAAVLVRQTNVVWVAFIAARMAIAACEPSRKPKKGTPPPTLAADLSRLISRAWTIKTRLVSLLWPFILVVASFAAFVVWNGGIVVGDKAHHAPVRHWAQPLYCLFYCSLALAPTIWTHFVVLETLGKARRAPFLAAAAAAVATAAVARGTLVHPFLLADNRHYTFYIWRRVINRVSWARYALIPGYLHAAAALDGSLAAAGRGPAERLVLTGAAAAVLVPAHLIELRYYTPAFYAAFLMGRTPVRWAAAATVAAYLAVNAVTLYVFMKKPFVWGDGSEARFMW